MATVRSVEFTSPSTHRIRRSRRTEKRMSKPSGRRKTDFTPAVSAAALILSHLVIHLHFAGRNVPGDSCIPHRSGDFHLGDLLSVAINVQPLVNGGHPQNP